MANLKVKTPNDIELEAAAEVAAAAFPNLSLEHWQESFNTVDKLFGRQFIFVTEYEGKIVSSMLCTPSPIYVEGRLIPHSAAGGVGTLPEYRNIGAAGAMLAECCRTLRREGIAASSLWPFSYEYYRKFGWEVGGEVRTYDLPSKVAAGIGNPNNARPAAPDDYVPITEVFESHMKDYNCLTDRSDEWWLKILKIDKRLRWADEPGDGTVVYESDRGLEGYAVYELRQTENGCKCVVVREIMFNEASQRRDMLALLATIDPEALIRLNAPLEDTLLQEIPNPRLVLGKVEPSFQFRVFDPVKAITLLKCDQGISGRVSFSISDPVFKEGFEFGVEVDNGKINTCKFDSDITLRMDIQTFARLFSGYTFASQALQLGQIDVPSNASNTICLADEIFGQQQPYRTWLEIG